MGKVRSSVTLEKDWSISFGQETHKFLVNFADLLVIRLSRDGSSRIQEVVMAGTYCKSTNSHYNFLSVQISFWESVVELDRGTTTEPNVAGCRRKPTFLLRKRKSTKPWFFFSFVQFVQYAHLFLTFLSGNKFICKLTNGRAPISISAITSEFR